MATKMRSEIRRILGEAHTEEMENALVALHLSVVDPLKDERDRAKQDAERYKADADKVEGLQKEIETLKTRKDYKAEYDQAVKDLSDYKAQVTAEAETAKVRAAYKRLLSDEKISDKRHEAILKVTDFSGMKLDKDGNLENADKLKEQIGKDWGEFRVSTRERGPAVENPPVIKGPGKMSRDEIMAIKDDGERQKAIAANLDVFGVRPS